MSNNSNLLKSFYNALPQHAEGGTQSSQLYVSRYADNSYDPVANIIEYIDWDDSTNGNTFLFTGLRGSGKTTELTKLIQSINASSDKVGFYCDISSYINLNEPRLTTPELLLIALAGLSKDVQKMLNHNPIADTIWDRLKRAMKSDVSMTPKANVAGGAVGAELDFSLHENPEFKDKLRQFSQDSTEFLKTAREFAQEILDVIKQKTNKQKVVLVVDSLERLNAPSGEETLLFNTWKEIFFANSDALKLSGFSIVYTAPPYLHAILPNVDAGFTESFTLPNFKVLQKSTESGNQPRNQAGIDKMLDIIEKRFASFEAAIDKSVVSELAYLSGGNVRRFFDLIRTTAMKANLLKVSLPISDTADKSVEQAIQDQAQPLQWLNAKDRTWLEKIRAKNAIPADEMKNMLDELPTIIRLFDHSLVLNYRNGDVWYQVPPLVSRFL